MKRCGSYSDVSHKVQMSSSNLVGTPSFRRPYSTESTSSRWGLTPRGPLGGSKLYAEDAFPPTHLLLSFLSHAQCPLRSSQELS